MQGPERQTPAVQKQTKQQHICKPSQSVRALPPSQRHSLALVGNADPAPRPPLLTDIYPTPLPVLCRLPAQPIHPIPAISQGMPAECYQPPSGMPGSGFVLPPHEGPRDTSTPSALSHNATGRQTHTHTKTKKAELFCGTAASRRGRHATRGRLRLSRGTARPICTTLPCAPD